MSKRFTKMVFLGIKQFSDPYYQGFAAQIAFYFLLAIVPTLIVLSQLLGIFDISLDRLDIMVNRYVSDDVSGIVKQLLSYKSTATTNIFLIVGAMWAASRAQFSLMRIANFTFTGGKSTGKGFWRERFRAIWSMGLILFTIAFVAVILVYGKVILELLFGTIFEGTLADSMWTYFRWPVTMILYFLMVSYTYYMLPSDKLTYREIIPGGIFGSIAMLVVTFFYSIYTNYITNYDIIYGSLASIVALLFWFYFLAWALCLGILFNKVWRDTKEGEQFD